MKNQIALLLIILVLGTITSIDVQQVNLNGKSYDNIYDNLDGHNYGKKIKPCSLLKKLLKHIENLSADISINISKERAEYKSKTLLQRGLQRQLRKDLKIQDQLIKQVNHNDGRIAKHRGNIRSLKQNLKDNERNLENVDRSIRKLNKDLSLLIHQKNHLIKEYDRSRGIKGSLINENIINRKQIRQLQRSIKQLLKQIKKLKIKRAFLHIQLIKCSHVVKHARRLYRKNHHRKNEANGNGHY